MEEALTSGYALVLAMATGCMGGSAWPEVEEQENTEELDCCSGFDQEGPRTNSSTRIISEDPACRDKLQPGILGDITNVALGSPQRPRVWEKHGSPQSKVLLGSPPRMWEKHGKLGCWPQKSALMDISNTAALPPQMMEHAATLPGATTEEKECRLLAEAAAAVREASGTPGLDSQWTSHLATRLVGLTWGGRDGIELDCVLRAHGWDGVQFAGPPDRRALLRDLHNARASSTKAIRRAKPRHGGA